MEHKRATFITIERPLEPQPPVDSRPYWCYANTLIFYDGFGREVWRQDIPESKMSWMKHNGEQECDRFEKYGHCEIFFDENFGWQLRWSISHNRAKMWHKKILNYIDNYHKKHFKQLDTSIPPAPKEAGILEGVL